MGGPGILSIGLYSIIIAFIVYTLYAKRAKIKAVLGDYGFALSEYFTKNPHFQKWLIIAIIAIVIFAVLYIVPNNCWECDRCGKVWMGNAYYGSEYSDTLCKDCAWKYWEPLPIENYKK